MNFLSILELYVNHLRQIQSQFCRGEISEDTLNQLRFLNFNWFHDMCRSGEVDNRYIEDFDLSDEDKEEYDDQGKDFPLISLLQYRGEIIPCYADDNGQQIFAIIRGREVSGGAYNVHYIEDFCDYFDFICEKEIIEQIKRNYNF